MSRMVWLASYPKSGNTWLRIFLENYRADRTAPAGINAVHSVHAVASARVLFDGVVGYESEELDADEVDALRPDLYRYHAQRQQEPIYWKVHDAYTRLPDGRPLFPPEDTKAAVYIVRNPLDVLVSYAHHEANLDFEQWIAWLGNPELVISESPDRRRSQFRQKLLSWSLHTASWLDRPAFPVHLLRYEDMQREPEAAFGGVVRFLGLPEDPDRLRRAIAFSRFDEVREQERKTGFREKPVGAKVFFRSGRIGSWRDHLGAEQMRRVVSDHAGAMRRFGYLDETGAPVF